MKGYEPLIASSFPIHFTWPLSPLSTLFLLSPGSLPFSSTLLYLLSGSKPWSNHSRLSVSSLNLSDEPAALPTENAIGHKPQISPPMTPSALVSGSVVTELEKPANQRIAPRVAVRNCHAPPSWRVFRVCGFA